MRNGPLAAPLESESSSGGAARELGKPAARLILPLSAAKAAAFAFLCGLLYFLAFPGLSVWPLGFVALVPLRIALVGQTPRRAAWIGWLSGMTMVSFGFYWLLDMMRAFSGFSTPLCLFFVEAISAIMGARMAFFAWLFVRCERNGWRPGLCFLGSFVASELMVPVLFFWSYGAVSHPVPVLTQIADLGGIYAAGLTMVAFNWALAELTLSFIAREKPAPRRWLAFACVPIVSAIYGAIRIPMVDARDLAAPAGRVGLVQANMGLMEKRQEHERGLGRHLDGTHEMLAQGPLDLVIWSESSVMSPILAENASRVLPHYFTRRLGVPTVFGAVLYDRVSDARHAAYYNSVLLSDRAGEVIGRYDKQELVAFSEHMPFGEEFPILFEISPNSSNFSVGTHATPLVLGQHHIAAMVCNDDVSPSLGNRLLADPETDLLVNLTNDAWFGDTTEPWIHLALAKFRAIEHRRYFVRSTNSGVSAFIDPVGRIMAHTGTFREQTMVGVIHWLKGRTVYELLGDWPYWSVCALMVLAAFVRKRPTDASSAS